MSYNFTWRMTEKEWRDLLMDDATIRSRSHAELSETADVYGNVYVGALCADIQHTLDPGACYAFANVFVQRPDATEATTRTGKPYDLTDADPHIPMEATTFEDFQRQFEDNFTKEIDKYNFAVYANEPTAVW